MNRTMEHQELFVDGWSFCKTKLGTQPEEMREREADFTPVEIPHDWLIYDTQNLYEDSCGWYKNRFFYSGEGRLQLYFEGVYMDSTVYVNGQKAMDWKYGYSSFLAELSDYAREGENEVLVQVRHQAPNSRWYSGAGIYRKVWLITCPAVYLPLHGTYVHSETAPGRREAFSSPAGKDFVMELETRVAGALSEKVFCQYELWLGETLVETSKEVFCQKALCREGDAQTKAAGRQDGQSFAEETLCSQMTVTAPKLWDLEQPVCYTLLVKVYDDGTLMDCKRETVGFRTMEFDPQRGFCLNGTFQKIHGVCEHHDLGCLGAAFHKPALKRKFTLLKEMGVNGLRTSHNMPAPEFMELADEMGFVVLSEAFDMWERSKTEYDYARFFVEWAQRDVASWIMRDRNHPSLFLWSIGNEIYDTHADAHGQEITSRLLSYVKKYDPKGNAPVTIASNYMPWEGAQACADLVKFAGYNYGERCYAAHHAEHPDWIIYGSETASVVASRGIYHFPHAQPLLSDEDEQCSALGNSSTSWGADSIEQCIANDEQAEFSFGQFLWTGFDYIGEPTPYHTKNSYFGQLDTAGFPKDSYYILQAQWTDAETRPMVHVFPYWDFNPGQMIDVRATSNGSAIELFVNGISQGRQELNHAGAERLLGQWQVPYAPGEILAVAYDAEGKEIARESRVSFGDSAKIVLTPDKEELTADQEDLCFLTIETVDKEGRKVENAADYVTVTVQGEGRLLGLDNGDSTDYDPYKGSRRKLFSGKLLAVIAATQTAGEIKVTVTGEGLESAEVRLPVQAPASPVRPKHVLEDCAGWESHLPGKAAPVRKIELEADGVRRLTADCPQCRIRARIFPPKAQAQLIWQAVNDSGIAVASAEISAAHRTAEGECVTLTARGDDTFRVRCMAKEPSGRITVISQLEFAAEGLGKVTTDPYELVIAGLYTEKMGEIGNGNEKGISTAREGASGIFFDRVDFGEYGSDELTMPIFALDDMAYNIEIWLGREGEADSRLIDTVVYQKPSVWNTYQPQTWKLKERLKGVCRLGFVLRDQKLHIKGFVFTRYEKAFAKLSGQDADRIYGDAFVRNGECVEGIGNNVTLEYERMQFGQKGAGAVVICGRTPLPKCTLHIRFATKDGAAQNRILEFDLAKDYTCRTFEIEPLYGEGRVDLVFLPGSRFDLASLRFVEA